jgi:hypothetical protein
MASGLACAYKLADKKQANNINGRTKYLDFIFSDLIGEILNCL